MRIAFIEIQNFRKLKAVRIDLASEKTVFVGANNSGKTSAMVALRHFLVDPKRISIHDFTVSNLLQLHEIGIALEKLDPEKPLGDYGVSKWATALPSIDVWMHVEPTEIHHVTHLLPTLDWNGGVLGVRLRLEPTDAEKLAREFVAARKAAETTIASAAKANDGSAYTLPLWPQNMREFLERKMPALLVVRSYLLDATKLLPPENGMARPQVLAPDSEPMDRHPFDGLLRIDEINAQRGFSDVQDSNQMRGGFADEKLDRSQKRKLSEQLRSYYATHLDPSETPEPSDIDALEAIYRAQKLFDEKLKDCFAQPLEEMEELGYPGVSDPKLILTTKIRPIDGLSHASALQYQINSAGNPAAPPRLPEQYCGLGYQNLISMVFMLMSFRDAWMQVRKAKLKAASANGILDASPPLHLVLIEEPEAHLHAQVQQVFIRKAYEILRRHPDLGASTMLTTQLLVSTHSSHIAHECEFSALRYFRRRPATRSGEVPTSVVINLSEVFGPESDTKRFVIRYLRAMHCDLFFADAAILVEGPAERILVPHFIRSKFPALNYSYITILEIGGSHAHRLKPLIEHLGLITLVIADLDAADPDQNGKSVQPKRRANLVSRNTTLKDWTPKLEALDELLDCEEEKKELPIDEFSSVRAAYQSPITIPPFNLGGPTEALANTFEDALVFSNLELFKKIDGIGLVPKFREEVEKATSSEELGKKFFDLLKSGDKAQFALDILMLRGEPEQLVVPKYIAEGLEWLESKVKRKQEEIVTETVAAVAETVAEAASLAEGVEP
jgi:predicted ATP-dependent endonuclease of OLD family